MVAACASVVGRRGGLAVGQPLDGRVGVDDARADRQVLGDEVHPGRDDARRAVAVDEDDRFMNFAS